MSAKQPALETAIPGQQYFVPKKGLLIRRPERPHEPIEEDGAWVEPKRYYRRRVRDGDGELHNTMPKAIADKKRAELKAAADNAKGQED